MEGGREREGCEGRRGGQRREGRRRERGMSGHERVRDWPYL